MTHRGVGHRATSVAKNWDKREKAFFKKGEGVIEKSREGGGDEAERGVTARGKVEAGTDGGRKRKSRVL